MRLCPKTHTNLFSVQQSCEFKISGLPFEDVLQISLVYRESESLEAESKIEKLLRAEQRPKALLQVQV